jgi:glycosyltransferase involved in cell wall biosynthesis
MAQSFPFCIDGRMASVPGTGVATYSRALLAATREAGLDPFILEETPGQLEQAGWRRLARVRRWIKASACGTATIMPAPERDRTWIGEEIFRLAQVHFDAHGRLLMLRPPLPVGIMHWTYPVPLRIEGWRNIYTVHDVIPLGVAGMSPVRRLRHSRLLRQITESADLFVTVSEAARAEIVAALQCPPGFVVDCSQAVEPAPGGGTLPPGVQPGGYFLFCGAIEPRKNLAALAAAYRLSGVSLPLLIAGPDGWCAPEISGAIGFGDRIRRLPYQSRADLGALIAGARALLFPSLAEGFGLPVAEAMAAGTPVMTSDRGALAETAGDAAALVDPGDVGGMAATIARLARDDAFCAALSARGRERALAFTTARFGEKMRTLYAGLVDRTMGATYRPQADQETDRTRPA